MKWLSVVFIMTLLLLAGCGGHLDGKGIYHPITKKRYQMDHIVWKYYNITEKQSTARDFGQEDFLVIDKEASK